MTELAEFIRGMSAGANAHRFQISDWPPVDFLRGQFLTSPWLGSGCEQTSSGWVNNLHRPAGFLARASNFFCASRVE
jgi:hypothetical protein